MNFDVDALMEEMRERETIRCPYCGTAQQDEEYQCVSYWGSDMGDGPYEYTCEVCDEEFFVDEFVERTYKTGKTVEEARGH